MVLVKIMSKFNKEPFIYGCASSFISCIALQPFDVIKTQIQEVESKVLSNSDKIRYISVLKRIYSTNGISAFWNGLSIYLIPILNFIHFLVPTVFRNVPGTGIYFFTLDYLKRTKIPDSALMNLAYGSLSRIIAGQILMPFTVLKINQEVSGL